MPKLLIFSIGRSTIVHQSPPTSSFLTMTIAYAIAYLGDNAYYMCSVYKPNHMR